MEPSNPLLVALDVPSLGEAARYAQTLAPIVGGMKVGLELFCAEGPAVVEEVAACGAPVFLDLKFHDIPNTVASAVRSAAKLGVWMTNVHASAGSEALRSAAQAASEVELGRRPLIVAVTVLTSLTDTILAEELGVSRSTEAQVVALAKLAQDSGLDGVVASPKEVRAIREACGPDLIIVTPGVRPAWAGADDQKRVATPAEAICDGANYVVVGRPVLKASDPVEAAQTILSEIESEATAR